MLVLASLRPMIFLPVVETEPAGAPVSQQAAVVLLLQPLHAGREAYRATQKGAPPQRSRTLLRLTGVSRS